MQLVQLGQQVLLDLGRLALLVQKGRPVVMGLLVLPVLGLQVLLDPPVILAQLEQRELGEQQAQLAPKDLPG